MTRTTVRVMHIGLCDRWASVLQDGFDVPFRPAAVFCEETDAPSVAAMPVMHELSIALSILDIAAEEAERRGGVDVLAVHLKLGPLAGVVKEALISAYDLARESSLLPNSRLVVEEIPLVVYCLACRAQHPAASPSQLYCSCCGALAGEVVQGRELEIVALEIAA